MTDETAQIARAAAALDDPYAALNQHLHGDGDSKWRTRALAAEAEVARLRAALSDLVTCNERWNESVQQIIGRVPNWTDGYLDRARAALRGDRHD